MRRLFVATAAALTIAGASLVAAGSAQAMPLPGAAGLGAAAQSGLVQDVRTVCRPVWNGYGWVQSCYWVPGPAYYGPGPYYGPRYYGGGPRFYGPRAYGPRYRAYRRW
jgi:hypothetical protein